MPRYDVGERVLFTHTGKRQRGRVTAVEKQNRRLVSDSGKRLVVPSRGMRPSPDRVLILETRLDRNLKKSKRIYGPMMQQWLQAMHVDALYERVHTMDDVKKFLQAEGKNVATRIVHFMGHGKKDHGRGMASLHLTFEWIDLGDPDHLEIFRGLNGKVLIFSCCQVGADAEAMLAVKKISGAAAVIAYRKEVDDWYTNVAEGMLYERLINAPALSPKKVVRLVTRAIDLLGIRLPDEVTRKPVLVCF